MEKKKKSEITNQKSKGSEESSRRNGSKENKESKARKENKESKARKENKEVKGSKKNKRNIEISDKKVAKILDTLRQRGEYVTTVESLTAGMISARIADIPGSSDVLRRAFVTYSDEAKHEMVHVKKKTLKKRTAVSRQVAEQMAKGGAKMAEAAACVSATGYAGPPSGPDDDTVGLVYLGCCYHNNVVVEEHHYSGARNEVRMKAMNDALLLLLKVLEATV